MRADERAAGRRLFHLAERTQKRFPEIQDRLEASNAAGLSLRRRRAVRATCGAVRRRFRVTMELSDVMKPSEALPQYRETIRQLVLQAGMSNPRVFGSVLRGEDTEGSDLDILVDPAPRASLLDLAGLQIEIEARTGVKVDLLTPMCLPSKFRQRVIEDARPV